MKYDKEHKDSLSKYPELKERMQSLLQNGEKIMPKQWKAEIHLVRRLPHFYGKIDGYMVAYRSKDKNTTQGNLAELVGSPVAPAWGK